MYFIYMFCFFPKVPNQEAQRESNCQTHIVAISRIAIPIGMDMDHRQIISKIQCVVYCSLNIRIRVCSIDVLHIEYVSITNQYTNQ